MAMAAVLAFRFKGSGIAFALSFASAVNTAALLFFLRKNSEITLGRTLRSALLYAAKLILFSAIAVIPVLLISPWLSGLFTGRSRLVSQGVPLFINALVYAAAGLVLLAITRDKLFLDMVKMIKKESRE
jgi:putative peptidoglycan lipid II flippase